MKELIKKITAKLGYQTEKKQVFFLSDDWGSVRMKSKKDQDELLKKGFIINNRFDQFDTLESNEDLENLFEVLSKHKDYSGNHPCITAVTNVANPDFNKIKAENFEDYHFESIEDTYLRYPHSNRVLKLTKEGIQSKIFVPQSHGREHVQVNWWMKELQIETSYARMFFDHEFFFLRPIYLSQVRRNRGIGASFDVWKQEDITNTKKIARNSLELFEKLYGYYSVVFTPPAIFYNPSIEKEIKYMGVDWLDVGRLFKVPLPNGKEAYQWNYLGKKRNSGLRVLVRNGMFEPNISETDNGVERAIYDIEQAFKLKQPALLSNHRAAFVGGIDPKNRDKGLKALDELLSKILKKWPDIEFNSLCDLK